MKKYSEIYWDHVESTWSARRHGWNPQWIKRYGEYKEIEGKLIFCSTRAESKYKKMLSSMIAKDTTELNKLAKS